MCFATHIHIPDTGVPLIVVRGKKGEEAAADSAGWHLCQRKQYNGGIWHLVYGDLAAGAHVEEPLLRAGIGDGGGRVLVGVGGA